MEKKVITLFNKFIFLVTVRPVCIVSKFANFQDISWMCLVCSTKITCRSYHLCLPQFYLCNKNSFSIKVIPILSDKLTFNIQRKHALPGGEYLLASARSDVSTVWVVPWALAWWTLSSILPSSVCSLLVIEKLEYRLSLQTHTHAFIYVQTVS